MSEWVSERASERGKNSGQISQSSYGKRSSRPQKMFWKAERTERSHQSCLEVMSCQVKTSFKKLKSQEMSFFLNIYWGPRAQQKKSTAAAWQLVNSCSHATSQKAFLFVSLNHMSVHRSNPDTEGTFMLKRQLRDNLQILTGRQIYKKSSKYSKG